MERLPHGASHGTDSEYAHAVATDESAGAGRGDALAPTMPATSAAAVLLLAAELAPESPLNGAVAPEPESPPAAGA